MLPAGRLWRSDDDENEKDYNSLLLGGFQDGIDNDDDYDDEDDDNDDDYGDDDDDHKDYNSLLLGGLLCRLLLLHLLDRLWTVPCVLLLLIINIIMALPMTTMIWLLGENFKSVCN